MSRLAGNEQEIFTEMIVRFKAEYEAADDKDDGESDAGSESDTFAITTDVIERMLNEFRILPAVKQNRWAICNLTKMQSLYDTLRDSEQGWDAQKDKFISSTTSNQESKGV
jgi:hypothetical protein